MKTESKSNLRRHGGGKPKKGRGRWKFKKMTCLNESRQSRIL